MKKNILKLSQISSDYEPNMTFREIADLLQCSNQNVIEIYCKAMTKLIKNYNRKSNYDN